MDNTMATRGRKPFAQSSMVEFLMSQPSAFTLPVTEAYDAYATWGVSTNGRVASYNTFKAIITSKDFRKISANIASQARLTAPVQAQEPKRMHLPLIEQFTRLEHYVGILADGNMSALYVGGDSSIGKTDTVMKALKRLETPYIVYNGGSKGAAELAQILYNNRDGKVIVFDDFDSIFKNKQCRDLLKSAMDDTKTRHISWVDMTKRGKKLEVPQQFTFTSGIIVISNVTKIDKALRSRMQVSIIQATKEESLEWVRSHLNGFVEGVPMNLKMDVYEFLKGNLQHFKMINYRIFKNILMDRLIDLKTSDTTDTWKRMALSSGNF